MCLPKQCFHAGSTNTVHCRRNGCHKRQQSALHQVRQQPGEVPGWWAGASRTRLVASKRHFNCHEQVNGTNMLDTAVYPR